MSKRILEAWEYCEDYADDRDGWTDILNAHGDDGWELVAVVPEQLDADGEETVGSYRLVFKRPKRDEDDE